MLKTVAKEPEQVVNLSPREVMLKHLSNHICDEFNLGDDFIITDIKASKYMVTLFNQEYTITVTVRGAKSIDAINQLISEELRLIQEAQEEIEE